MQKLEIDYETIFRVIPKPKKGTMDGFLSGEMFSLADEDYLCYWLFSHATRAPVRYRRIALYHLSQALEKYLKCLYMAKSGDLPMSLQIHDLPKLLSECATIEPALGSGSLVRFCRDLDNVISLARYPDPKATDWGFRRFTPDVDRVLQAIRELAKAADGASEKQLIERIIDRELEWNPDTSAGWLTHTGASLGEACRQALLTTHQTEPRRG